MDKNRSSGVDIGLIHYPVINKIGETIGSAVTNLDIHDIARAAKTYGIDDYYIVTPYEDQRQLVTEICDHWLTGHGAGYNPARKQALELVTIMESVEKLITRVTQKRGQMPLLVTTSATVEEKTLSYGACRRKIKADVPLLLFFGTAHGLDQSVVRRADYILPPITGGTGYNHLSVRSAVSIILDRLMGRTNDHAE